MLSLLLPRRRATRSAGPARPPLDGFRKGRSLPLPGGEIFAEEGVAVRLDSVDGDRVEPLRDEAWVAVRLDLCTDWYAVWRPDGEGWEVLSIEAAREAAPAAQSAAQRRAS